MRSKMTAPIAFGVAIGLWVLDAAVRAAVLAPGSFGDQLARPSADALFARIPVMVLGVVIVYALHGVRLLADARAEAVAERRRQRELYDNTTDGIAFLDPQLRIVSMNKATERIIGKRFTDCVGRTCHDAFMGVDEPCAGCKALAAMASGVPQMATKYEVTDAGQENWIEQHWYPVMNDAGEIEAVLEVARDITDVKMLERELAVCHREVDEARGMR